MKQIIAAAALAAALASPAAAQDVCASHKKNLELMDDSLSRLVAIIVGRAGREIDPKTGKPEGAVDHDKVTAMYAASVAAFNRQRDDLVAQLKRDNCPL